MLKVEQVLVTFGWLFMVSPVVILSDTLRDVNKFRALVERDQYDQAFEER